MSTILVFGASGPVGRFLLPLIASRSRVLAVSRTPRIADSAWLCADINDARVAWPDADTVISLGPLDAFAAWLERRGDAGLRRVIALGSMSVESKRDSADADERALAMRLQAAEQQVMRIATERHIAATLFRPTLIYGAGTDRSLAPIARLARRWRILPLPIGASGLRQPVHARDLAKACIAALDTAATYGKIYPLGGGERLPFDALLRRLRDAAGGTVVLLPVPIALLHLFGHSAFGAAALARLREPLIADNAAAQRDFGYTPVAFDAAAVLPE
jgi:nucleoside-diphosphate-sugar epimerase